jgi:endonuclease/exonuclease/phosphatase family metal-dependent hydrolase
MLPNMLLRIATYNCLHGGSSKRNGHVERLVCDVGAHIVLTQEARPSSQPSRDGLFWRAVPGYRWGSGILVRGMGATEIRVRGFEGWVIGVELGLRRKTRIFSVHCPAGEKGYVRTMHQILDTISPMRMRADLVIGGDFNVAAGYRGPDEPVRMSKGERELLDRMTSEFKLVPCWQAMHPDVPLGQTLRWMANRRAPYHCDGIFIPRSWQPRLKTCEILAGRTWKRLSDHNPVVAELDFES